MKTYLIIVLLILFKLTFAQDNEKIKLGTPINSGFVFIDGKYIEPPYKFSYKKGNVYINGIEASITPEIKKHFQKGKKKYIEPIFKLDKNLGWFEYLSMINPLTGNKYYTDYMDYLFTKYPNTSREQFEKFIRDLPFVQSYENGYLKTYNGETHPYIFMFRKPITNNQQKKLNKDQVCFNQNVLSKGGTIIYFKDNLPRINRFDTLETICLLEDLYKNTDSINWYYLTDKYIYNQSIPKEYIIDLLQDIKNNQKLKQRFENVKKNFYKLENGVNEKKTNETPLQRDKSSTSFSPKENSVTYFCPYTFDESFSGYNQIINVFQNKLSGYNYSVSYYVDNTDNNCLDFSLDALKNVSSGIVCLDAHGTSAFGGKITLFYSLDIGACESLIQNENDLSIGQTTFPGDNTIYWVVLAGQEWFANNWENRLTQNNSLVFVLACEGSVLLETYGGGAASAYFHKTNVDYAVLALYTYSAISPNDGVLCYKVFTNEVGDNGAGDNSNSTTINGNDIYSLGYSSGWIGQCWFSNYSHPHKISDYPDTYHCNYPHNAKYYPTRLAFYFFPKRNSNLADGFPQIGISYGVFGRFGNHQGYIFTDDEDQDWNDSDKNCSNYEGNNNSILNPVGSDVNNCVVEEGSNTRLYISRVTDCVLP